LGIIITLTVASFHDDSITSFIKADSNALVIVRILVGCESASWLDTDEFSKICEKTNQDIVQPISIIREETVYGTSYSVFHVNLTKPFPIHGGKYPTNNQGQYVVYFGDTMHGLEVPKLYGKAFNLNYTNSVLLNNQNCIKLVSTIEANFRNLFWGSSFMTIFLLLVFLCEVHTIFVKLQMKQLKKVFSKMWGFVNENFDFIYRAFIIHVNQRLLSLYRFQWKNYFLLLRFWVAHNDIIHSSNRKTNYPKSNCKRSCTNMLQKQIKSLPISRHALIKVATSI